MYCFVHFLSLQVYHDSEEGQRYIQFYKLNKFPYISILDPRTGECSWEVDACFQRHHFLRRRKCISFANTPLRAVLKAFFILFKKQQQHNVFFSAPVEMFTPTNMECSRTFGWINTLKQILTSGVSRTFHFYNLYDTNNMSVAWFIFSAVQKYKV